MVATQVQRRRGTATQCEAMIPAEGEIIVDLTNDTLRVGDGLAAGGFIMPNAQHIQNNKFNFAVDSSVSANTILVSFSPVPAYAQPLNIKFKAANTNTGAVQINVNSIGLKDIKKAVGGTISALVAGDIVAGGIYEIIYDGTQFLMLSGAAGGNQASLSTSTGSVSGYNVNLLLPGGEYGFYPNISGSGSSQSAYLYSSNTAWSKGPYINFSSAAMTGYQRYITASPPYDLGDGDVGGFIFAMLSASGEIEGFYVADTPPWAYNGPTDVRATYTCPVTGKKYKNAPKRLTKEEIMSGAKIEFEQVEITHAIKNADMELIPHPFCGGDISKIVLLDPMSDKVQRLVTLQNSGQSEEVTEILRGNYLEISNTTLKRGCHKSVKACGFKYKNSRK